MDRQTKDQQTTNTISINHHCK